MGPWWLLAGHGKELLGVYVIEPVRKGAISATERCIVGSYRFLVILVQVRRSYSCDVVVVRDRVHASTLSIVYSSHRSPFCNFLAFVSQRNDVEVSRLEVDQTFLFTNRLGIASL